MGWLQGSRIKNVQQLKEDYADGPFRLLLSKGEPNATHVERVCPSTTALGSVQGTIPSESINPSNNVVGELLEAIFGQGNKVNQQRDGNRLSSGGMSRSLQNEDTSDQELPFISKEEVISKKLAIENDGLIDERYSKDLWIVVDNIVYDCSQFIQDHPGGKQVILSFVGEDCSWQFWRFHSHSQLSQYGRPLRIGQTAGIPNRFDPRPKYIGLAKIGHDEW